MTKFKEFGTKEDEGLKEVEGGQLVGRLLVLFLE